MSKIKINKPLLVYSIICNIPVCFFLCITSAICGVTEIEGGVLTTDFRQISLLNLGANFILSFILAMIISYFIPLRSIGKWFTGLFGIKNDTYTDNVPYRLLATLISSFIFYLGISPTLMVVNYFALRTMDFNRCLLNLLIDFPIMLLVGFTSSLINDIGAFKVAHKMDANF